MLHFKKIEWKNFLSTGNSPITIELDGNRKTLISGTNGEGKSQILDALTFGLYGKPFRNTPKPNLVNDANKKKSEVKIWFEKNGIEWCVTRGQKPTVFIIERNGEVLPEIAGIREFQEYFETEILQMNHKTFVQMVILGSTNYVPFMRLSASQRRLLIEDLLDIKVFSEMNLIHKEKVNEISTLLSKIEDKENRLRFEIGLLEQNIQNLQNKSNTHVGGIEERRDKLMMASHSLDSTLSAEESKLAELNKELSERNKKGIEEFLHKRRYAIQDSQSIITQSEKLKEFYAKEQGTCPTCKQDISVEFVQEKTKEIDETTKANEKRIVRAREDIQKLEERLESICKIENDISTVTVSIAELNQTIEATKKQLKDYDQQIEELKRDHSTEIEEVKGKLDTLQSELATLLEGKEKVKYEANVSDTITTLLKDSGIKTLVIREYIPIINNYVNTYLKEMGFYISFYLNDKFEEEILNRYTVPLPYDSFSEGEKLRMDLALLFAWRQIAKNRNSVNTNLIVLDEIFDGSLDNAGCEEFIKILNEICEANGLNAFVISHKGDVINDKFDSEIRFTKVKGFSECRRVK